MAYNPGIQYRGDQYLYQAITNLGEKAGEAIGNYRKDRAESQFLEEQVQGMVNSAGQYQKLVDLQDPQMAEALQKSVSDVGSFAGKSLAQKRAMVGQMRFQLDSLMKAADTRQQGRRADDYLGLQKKNVELGERRETREVAQEAARRQAGQRFLGELNQATQDPAGRNFSVNQDASGAPKRPLTVDQILGAGARAGGDLDPRLMGQVGELLQRGQQWNLQPGQKFDFGGGIQGVATSPGQVQAFNTTLRPTAGRGGVRTRTWTNPDTGEDERVTIPLTPEEIEQERQGATTGQAPPMPKDVEKLIKEYALHQAELDSGDTQNWRLASRAKRNKYIKTQLESLGYDTRGQPLGQAAPAAQIKITKLPARP